MNSSCPIGAFDREPSHIPWTIYKSKLSFQTPVANGGQVDAETTSAVWILTPSSLPLKLGRSNSKIYQLFCFCSQGQCNCISFENSDIGAIDFC